VGEHGMLKKRIKLLLIFFTMTLFFSIPINNAIAEGIEKEIDIATSPHKVIFDINNGKPGDTFTKVLKIQNNGTKDFNYLFTNDFITGSEKIYNELELTVSDRSVEIYNGKLKDYEKLDSKFKK
jgi:hypothetical protein